MFKIIYKSNVCHLREAIYPKLVIFIFLEDDATLKHKSSKRILSRVIVHELKGRERRAGEREKGRKNR